MDEDTLVEVDWTVYETRVYRRRVTLGELWLNLSPEDRREAERQAGIAGPSRLALAVLHVDPDDTPALSDSEDGGGAERLRIDNNREMGSARLITWPTVVPVLGD